MRELFYRALLLDMDSTSQDKKFTEDSELGLSVSVLVSSMYVQYVHNL